MRGSCWGTSRLLWRRDELALALRNREHRERLACFLAGELDFVGFFVVDHHDHAEGIFIGSAVDVALFIREADFNLLRALCSSRVALDGSSGSADA